MTEIVRPYTRDEVIWATQNFPTCDSLGIFFEWERQQVNLRNINYKIHNPTYFNFILKREMVPVYANCLNENALLRKRAGLKLYSEQAQKAHMNHKVRKDFNRAICEVNNRLSRLCGNSI